MVHWKPLGEYLLFVASFIIVLSSSPTVRKYHPRKECPIYMLLGGREVLGWGWSGGRQRLFSLK